MEQEFPLLETERLVLREITIEDASSILNYLSDKEVMKYYGLEPFQSVNDALDEISWYQSIFSNKTGVRWGITVKDQQELVGSCGFLNVDAQHARADIGFELNQSFWGRGIASETLKPIITYGFKQLKLQRIQALIEPANIASQKLVERHGFVREGLLRSYEYTCGKFDDLYMYSLLKQDFEAITNK
ncbi:N-acetyltransferase [Solibacillus sp. R5-41]|uniref:GNAT family N-acetyltransferase n=1 Tax=Solibacillus sp. R5-41 TaxID=2048654 RepID=UPI000C125F43|nr:GNAT family protein [Solibacillus sp. R5-41]ATP42269.1 N-acetyltransferase [Solibacillus sp. R5-41]